MSGINEIKKKAKLSIDEMYDSQSVGKLDSQKDRSPDIQKPIHPTNQLGNKPDYQLTGNPSFHETDKLDDHIAGQETIHQSRKAEINPDVKQGHQIFKQTPLFPTQKQQIQKTPTYKMTFNLTEDIYKAFNDLYANRMLQGRKTEKSEMICEAIQWLIKMEEA